MGLSLTAIKFICAVVCAILNFLGTVLILCIRAPKLTERAESLAGGVFFGAGFAHLFFDSTNEFFEGGKNDYPITAAITIATFIILTIAEIFSYRGKNNKADENNSINEIDDLGNNTINADHQAENDSPKSANQSDSVSSGEDINLTVSGDRINIEESTNKKEELREIFSKKFHPLSVPVIVLYIIMLIHSFIEGLALGVMNNLSGVIALACAVGGHKPVEAFSLGLLVSQDRPTQYIYWTMMAIYVLISPIGIVVAIFISEIGNHLVLGIISAISAGTFIFVGCDEWSKIYQNKEIWPLSEKFWHIGLYIFGILWMLLIAIVEG